MVQRTRICFGSHDIGGGMWMNTDTLLGGYMGVDRNAKQFIAIASYYLLGKVNCL